ncbi:MAG: single-stranded DNA-binding protein [Treponema sp.]|nr:single-stranded DNA-binding protein [Treponema sp.]
MTDVNRVNIIGRLTRDINADERSFAYLPNGTARANVSIAVNRSRKNGDQWVDEVSYFDVTIWGKTAENLKPYLQKGKQIAVDGYLRQDRWEKDGQKNSRVTIVAENVQLLGGRSDNGGSGDQPSGGFAPKFQPRPAGSANSAPSPMDDVPYGEDNNFPEDIPF